MSDHEESEKRQKDIDKWNKIHEAQASQTCEEQS